MSEAATSVWLVEEGEYEQRCVMFAASSLEVAVATIKRIYGSPYIVAWHQIDHDKRSSTLTGDFESVHGYSIKHRAHFGITEYEVEHGEAELDAL